MTDPVPAPEDAAEVDPETGAVTFQYGGAEYHMVFDMKAVAFFERSAAMSLIDALEEMETAKVAGASPKISTLTYLMQAALRRHHPEVTPERAMRMALDLSVRKALGIGLTAAAPPAGDASKVGNARTPVKPGRKRKSGTSSGNSRSRSKPA